MPSQQIVTTLFCAISRDNTLANYVLNRINAGAKELDGCLYEGTDYIYVPIFYAVETKNLNFYCNLLAMTLGS